MTPLLVILAGVLIGLSLGTLGAGGAILTVPVLVYLAGQGAHEATTGSLVIVGATCLIALIPHARRGGVRVRPALTFAALGTVGSVIGSRGNAHIPPALLLSGFALLLLGVGILMLRTSLAGPAPAEPESTDRVPPIARSGLLRLVLVAAAVGLLTGFFGVGGGFALVPALVLLVGLPMPHAIGTSLLIITLNSATALVARADRLADLDWGLIGALLAVTAVASILGTRLSSRLSATTLTRTFAMLLLVVGTGIAAVNLPAIG